MLKINTYEHIYDAQDRYETDCAAELVNDLMKNDVEYSRIITPQFIRIIWREVMTESETN